MKFAISNEQRYYYQQNQHIEFENVLTAAQSEDLKKAIERTLFGMLKQKTYLPEDAFIYGHDLWRQDQIVKKVTGSKRLAEITAELTEQKPIRLGYDQVFYPQGKPNPFEKKTEYLDFLQTSPTLQEISSIQGITAGVMLCLGAKGEEKAPILEEKPSVFSRTPGNAVWLSPNKIIDLKDLYQRNALTYLLIVYTQLNSVYIYQQKDKHTHYLKNLGYSFGDRLSDKLNPVIIR